MYIVTIRKYIIPKTRTASAGIGTIMYLIYVDLKYFLGLFLNSYLHLHF